MAGFISYMRLFRWNNLLIMALTQVFFRYGVIIPAFSSRGVYSYVSDFDFFLLVLSTLSLSAAAYAINDYFDLRIDRINKPHKIILGKKLSRRQAILAHSLLNFLGVATGIYISWKIGYWPLAFVFLFIPAVLWLYTIRYKRKFLLGNLVVAFLSAFVIGIVWVVEYRAMIQYNHLMAVMNNISLYARVFAFFAFFLTLIREVVKDAEDVHGDSRAGCKTIPVVIGIRRTRRLLTVLTVLMVLFIAFAQYLLFKFGYHLLASYLLLLVQLPLLGLLLQTQKASSKKDFKRMQQIIKFIMLTGVLSMLFVTLYL